MNSIRILTAW